MLSAHADPYLTVTTFVGTGGTAVAGGGPAFARVMIRNPFARAMLWSDTRYQDANGFKTPDQANNDGQLLNVAFVYDVDSVNAASQNYRALATTPLLDSEISDYEGFWVRIEAAARGGANGGGTLHVPLSE